MTVRMPLPNPSPLDPATSGRSIQYDRSHLLLGAAIVLGLAFVLSAVGGKLPDVVTPDFALPFVVALGFLHMIASRPLRGRSSAHIRELRGLYKRTLPVTASGVIVAFITTIALPKGSLTPGSADNTAITCLVVAAGTLPCWAFVYQCTVVVLARWVRNRRRSK